ncbi:MAG: septum formation initiator family protein [Solobacterium sp.]|nr:septum formation initiator family protein [Solobacterium sp.]
MAEVKKKKRIVKKKMTPLSKLFSIGAIFVSLFLIFSVSKEITTTMKLQKELAEVRERLQEVKDENSFLNNEKTKLQDPDYVENYARGNYMLSKEGEQIFYLPSKNDE